MANFEFVLPPAPTKDIKVGLGDGDLVKRSS